MILTVIRLLYFPIIKVSPWCDDSLSLKSTLAIGIIMMVTIKSKREATRQINTFGYDKVSY